MYLDFLGEIGRSAAARLTRYSSLLVVAAAIVGCASRAPVPITESSALVMTPVGQTAIRDRRSEFRNIFCTVLEARMQETGQTGDCEDRLLRLVDESPPISSPVELSFSQQEMTVIFIAGFASDCVTRRNRQKHSSKTIWRNSVTTSRHCELAAYRAAHQTRNIFATPCWTCQR